MGTAPTGRAARLFKQFALLLGVIALPSAAQSPTDVRPVKPLVTTQAIEGTASMAGAVARPAELAKTNVDSWLDGMMPYALDSGGVAGAVVVVVKDGKILTARGFGYSDVKKQRTVDPERTLFRPGSISKLFGWTAVMQLVQAGKLDLDRDINAYLDFRIPPKFGKPITLRHLMTHTPGFEETVKYLILSRPEQLKPLDQVLKQWVPERIYAPGTMAAYSNYGASLAAYIVQRVSGEPFEQYVQRHIMMPIGMTRSTFAQPLPGVFVPDMANGYNVASEDTKAFELIDMAPAGALSSTGTDMARFMIAYLSHGGPLLQPRTVDQMFAPANTPIPGLPSMALGFYHEDRNGLRIIGHAGDLNWFHSDLHLYPDQGVGLYMSFNSAGKDAAAHVVRQQLFDSFTDRYFPTGPAPQQATATAKAHGELMVGHYIASRRSASNWVRLAAALTPTQIVLNDDDTITVSVLLNPAGAPKKWREVAPWQWHEVGGDGRLAAAVKDGKVTAWSIAEYAPVIVFLPAPASLNAGWIVPTLLCALGIMLLTALAWPIVATIRRVYGYRAPITSRALTLHRVTRITAWTMTIVAAGWAAIIMVLMGDISIMDGRLDPWMRLLQLLSLVGIVGAAVSMWNAYTVIRSREHGWAAKLWAILFVAAALFLVWLMIAMRTITPSLNY
jgi:CubicO group peptidase (beta-lactamase class C family)